MRVYRTMAYRPSGPTSHDQAIGLLTDQLPWLRAFADEFAADRLGGGGIAVEDERLGASTIGALRGSATEFETRRVTEAGGDLEAAREDYYAAVAASTRRHIAAHDAPDTIVESIRRAFRLRLISYISMSVSGNTSILSGRPVAPSDYEIPPLVPQPGLTQTVRGLGAIIRSHLALDSIWFRAAVRAALALGLAVLIAKVADVQHGFWVVLATLTVLKSNAISTGYAAWQALAGTLVGFGLSTAVILGVHDSRTALWILFPICVFLAAYTPTAVHVAVGQAMFTVMVVVLFNLIEPQGWRTGLVRVEDILIGAATGIVVGVLLWPRGARAQLCQALSSLYETGGAYIRAALDAALGRQREPVAPAAEEARAADLRAGEALSTYLKEHGPKRVPVDVWTRLLATGEQVRFVADAIVVRTSVFGEVEGFERAVGAVDAEAGILTEQIDLVARDISGTGDVGRAPPPNGDRTHAIIVASLEACGRDPSVGNVEQVLALAWASEWIGHVRTRVAALAGAARRGQELRRGLLVALIGRLAPLGLVRRVRPAAEGDHAGQSERHQRISERPNLDRTCLEACLVARVIEPGGSLAERHELLVARALLAFPDEQPRRPELEASERPDLDLERPLGAPDLVGASVPLNQTHGLSIGLGPCTAVLPLSRRLLQRSSPARPQRSPDRLPTPTRAPWS